MIVRLIPLDEAGTEALLAVAVAQAEPAEVMPVDGPTGWTEATKAAFRDFHAAHRDGALGTVMYAIDVRGETAGMIRLARVGPGVAETGMWLGRAMRSKGVGVDALRALLEIAVETGFHTVRAETTPDNTAAIRALARCGAVLTTTPTSVTAELHPTS
ncbi:GCN5-related N-acetyltransferase [Alloactinosynnema sp. L-07]|uniref:GNAT family N-acetyltransferase n=1 Tax=Alloactinosynnema sp. L-07 TaxID=1653480 RepID=UPI00065F0A74|nr:GNAT family protein [Alloactinosynnema sp. L-07]CRK60018.1 GCN5-related N-acetyltransferase [Alloactinosynnema sp. L-07]